MERVIRIGNAVEVQTVLFTEKVKGEEVIARTEIYTLFKIDNEIESIAIEKTRLLALNISDEVAEQDAKLPRLNEMKEMLQEEPK